MDLLFKSYILGKLLTHCWCFEPHSEKCSFLVNDNSEKKKRCIWTYEFEGSIQSDMKRADLDRKSARALSTFPCRLAISTTQTKRLQSDQK